MLKSNNTQGRPIPISRSQNIAHRESHFYPTRSSLPDCSANYHDQSQWSRLSSQDRSGEMVDLSSLSQDIGVSQCCVKFRCVRMLEMMICRTRCV